MGFSSILEHPMVRCNGLVWVCSWSTSSIVMCWGWTLNRRVMSLSSQLWDRSLTKRLRVACLLGVKGRGKENVLTGDSIGIFQYLFRQWQCNLDGCECEERSDWFELKWWIVIGLLCQLHFIETKVPFKPKGVHQCMWHHDTGWRSTKDCNCAIWSLVMCHEHWGEERDGAFKLSPPGGVVSSLRGGQTHLPVEVVNSQIWDSFNMVPGEVG